MSRQCTKRHIPDIEILQNELKLWAKHRNEQKIGVDWRFRTIDASIKLNKLYPS